MYFRAFIYSWIFGAFCLSHAVGFSLSEARAQPRGSERSLSRAPKECTVTVRALKGFRRAENDRRELKAGVFLKDVKQQLEAIPFSSFRVVDSTEEKVRLGERHEFTLIESGAAHRVRVRPCSVSGERVQVAVDWTGPDGTTFVSTKLGIVRGKPVVIGAEESDDSSTIMCIRADC